jgi:hypothetical protein
MGCRTAKRIFRLGRLPLQKNRHATTKTQDAAWLALQPEVTIDRVSALRREDDDLGLPPRASIKAVSHVRSTIVLASQARLRQEGLLERYLMHLPGAYSAELAQLGAPCWLPLTSGMAHYMACDALGLSEAAVVAMAQRMSMHGEGTFLGVAANIARGAGVTAWTLARQAPRIWARGFMGGAVGCTKLGPKELKLEVVGWPCARIPYCRWAIRGLTLGVFKLISREAYVRDLRTSLTPSDDIALQVSWV